MILFAFVVEAKKKYLNNMSIMCIMCTICAVFQLPCQIRNKFKPFKTFKKIEVSICNRFLEKIFISCVSSSLASEKNCFNLFDIF